MVDVHDETVGAGELEREHFDSGHARLDPLRDLAGQLPLLVVYVRGQWISFEVTAHRIHKKWAPSAHFAEPVKCGSETIANAGLLGHRSGGRGAARRRGSSR